jgi:hypothetical protein
MKIAYLIFAYNYPVHFHRLVRSLESRDVHCFAHVDQKVEMAPFNTPTIDYLTFVKRFRMARASFAMVQAMIELLRTATATDQFDYFIYLSGQDYPIKSNAYIANFLEAHRGQNFLAAYPVQPNRPKAENIFHYHNTALLSQLPKKLQRVGEKLFNLANRALPNRHLANGMTPYRGLTWMGLHRETAKYLLNFLDTPEGTYLYNFFRYVWAPDEFFFHTIILNSPYAECCYNYVPPHLQTNFQNNYVIDGDLHYIDWSPTREDPAIFIESDLPELLATDALFARKFDDIKSATLMDKLDNLFLAEMQQTDAYVS